MPVRPDPALGTDPASGGEEAYEQEANSTMQPGWLSLDQHSEDVRDQARALIDALQPALPEELREAVVVAGVTCTTSAKRTPLGRRALRTRGRR
ncbi:hypothetical protein ACFOW4_13925 [Micromonospora sp. GCM10011542]|uniref:hypothetical protein n=1 Tax=Micromonospora sp. GCM10011542 TaxID=3317337 RepID=UPI003618A821